MELRDKLLQQADGLALMAEEADAVAKHFRPRFEACWRDGVLTDGTSALLLRPYVIEREREAERFRREEAEIREAVTLMGHDR